MASHRPNRKNRVKARNVTPQTVNTTNIPIQPTIVNPPNISVSRDPSNSVQLLDPRNAIKSDFYSRAALDFINGGGNDGSINYSENQLLSAYMTSVYMYAALRRVMSLISRVKVVAEIKQGGNYIRTPDTHHINQLFARDGSETLSKMWLNYAIYGATTVYKVKTRRALLSMQDQSPIYRYDEGAVAGLQVIDKPQWEIVEDARGELTGLYIHNETSLDGTLKTRSKLERDEFVYVTDWNPRDKNRGKSIVSHAIHEAVTNTSIAAWAADYFTRGAMPFILVNMEDDPAMITDADLRKYKRQFEEYWQGKDSSLRSVMVDRKINVQQVGISASEVAAPELNETALEGISSAVGLDRELIVTPSGGSQARHAELVQRAWNDTIIPVAKQFIAAMERDLGLEEGMRLVLDLSDIAELEADRADKSSTELSIHDGGLQSFNETRSRMQMKPIPAMENMFKIDGQYVHIEQIGKIKDLPPQMLIDRVTQLYDGDLITRNEAKRMLGLKIISGEKDGYKSELDREYDNMSDLWNSNLVMKSYVMKQRGLPIPNGMVDGFMTEVDNEMQKRMDKQQAIMDLLSGNQIKRSDAQKLLGLPVNPSDIDGYMSEIDTVTSAYYQAVGDKMSESLTAAEGGDDGGDGSGGDNGGMGGDDSGFGGDSGMDMGGDVGGDTSAGESSFGETSPDEFGAAPSLDEFAMPEDEAAAPVDDVAFGTGEPTAGAPTTGDVSATAPASTTPAILPAPSGTATTTPTPLPIPSAPTGNVATPVAPAGGNGSLTDAQTPLSSPKPIAVQAPATAAAPSTPTPAPTPTTEAGATSVPAAGGRSISISDVSKDGGEVVPDNAGMYTGYTSYTRAKSSPDKYKTPAIRRAWWGRSTTRANDMAFEAEELKRKSSTLSNPALDGNVLNEGIRTFATKVGETDAAGTTAAPAPSTPTTPIAVPLPDEPTVDPEVDEVLPAEPTEEEVSDGGLDDGVDDAAELPDDQFNLADNEFVDAGSTPAEDGAGEEEDAAGGILPPPKFNTITPPGSGDVMDEIMETSASVIDDPLSATGEYNSSVTVEEEPAEGEELADDDEAMGNTAAGNTTEDPDGVSESLALLDDDSGLRGEMYTTLMLGNNPDLITLTSQLMPQFGDVTWESPSRYHVTVTYARMSSDVIDEDGYPTALASRVMRQMPDTVYLPEPLSPTALTIFKSDNDNKYYLVLLLERSESLLGLNRQVGSAISWVDGDAEMSQYSSSLWYTPHITMGWSPAKISLPSIYLSDMAIIPDSLALGGDGYEIFYRVPVIIGDEPTDDGGGNDDDNTPPTGGDEWYEYNGVDEPDDADTYTGTAGTATSVGSSSNGKYVSKYLTNDVLQHERVNELGELVDEQLAVTGDEDDDVVEPLALTKYVSSTFGGQSAGNAVSDDNEIEDTWVNNVAGALYTSSPEDNTDDGSTADGGRLSGAIGEADLSGDTWDDGVEYEYNQTGNIVGGTSNTNTGNGYTSYSDYTQSTMGDNSTVGDDEKYGSADYNGMPTIDSEGKLISPVLQQWSEDTLRGNVLGQIAGEIDAPGIPPINEIEDELEPLTQFVDLSGDGSPDMHLDSFEGEDEIELDEYGYPIEDDDHIEPDGSDKRFLTRNEIARHDEMMYRSMAASHGNRAKRWALNGIRGIKGGVTGVGGVTDEPSSALFDIVSRVNDNDTILDYIAMYTAGELLSRGVSRDTVIGDIPAMELSHRSCNTAIGSTSTKAVQQDMKGELKAWRSAAMKSYNKAIRFEALHLPEEVSDAIVDTLKVIVLATGVAVPAPSRELDNVELSRYRNMVNSVFTTVDCMVK